MSTRRPGLLTWLVMLVSLLVPAQFVVDAVTAAPAPLTTVAEEVGR